MFTPPTPDPNALIFSADHDPTPDCPLPPLHLPQPVDQPVPAAWVISHAPVPDPDPFPCPVPSACLRRAIPTCTARLRPLTAATSSASPQRIGMPGARRYPSEAAGLRAMRSASKSFAWLSDAEPLQLLPSRSHRPAPRPSVVNNLTPRSYYARSEAARSFRRGPRPAR